jgi:hypothetical protein
MTQKQRTTLLFTLLPLVVAVLIMLPRLVSPQFGIMDDSLIYVEVQKILEGDLSMSYDLNAGRFRPLYWLYFTLIYIMAGSNPFWFFFGHLVLLLTLLFEIRLLMKALRAEEWQILLTSLVFLFSIPIIENFYTLSKGDPLSLIFILASLLCFEKLKSAGNTRDRWIFALMAFLDGLFAIWAKETAYIMAPITACWAGIVFLQRKKFSSRDKMAYMIFFICMAASMGAFFIIRALFGAPPVSGGGFTARYDFTIESLMARIPRWITLFASYYHYLLPVAILIVVLIFIKRDVAREQKLPFFTWGVWLLAWIGALLPWEYARAYYLLSFSLGVSILIGLFAPYILDQVKYPSKSPRWITIGLSVAGLLLFLASLTHYRTHARTQLIFDRMNQHMLETTVEITPPDGRVFVSLEERKEYVEGIEYFLVDYYGLTEIDYTYISVEILERLHWYSGGVVIMPTVNNMPSLLVRAGVDNEFTMLWNEIVLRNKGDRLIPVTEFRKEFRIINLNLPVVFCPLVGPRGFCENPDPFLDTRLFSYGWEIFTIK